MPYVALTRSRRRHTSRTSYGRNCLEEQYVRQKIDTDTDIVIIGKTETDFKKKQKKKIKTDINLKNRHRPSSNSACCRVLVDFSVLFKFLFNFIHKMGLPH